MSALLFLTSQNTTTFHLFHSRSSEEYTERRKKEFLLPASSHVISARANVVVIHLSLLVLVRHHGWFVVHHISRETPEISQFRCHVLSVKVEHV